MTFLSHHKKIHTTKTILLIFIYFSWFIQSTQINSTSQLNKTLTYNVAHFMNQLGIGGIEKGLSVLLEYFQKRSNVNVILLTLEKKENEFSIPNIVPRYEILKTNNNTHNLNQLKTIIDKYHINIFVNHFYNAKYNFLNVYMHQIGIKVIYFSHNTLLNGAKNYRKNILKLNYDLFVSFINSNILYMTKLGHKNSLVMPNQITIDLNKIERSNLKNKTVLMVGGPRPVKNYEFGINVIKKVSKEIPEVKLMLVGFNQNENKYIKSIQNKIKQLNLENNVLIEGKTLNVSHYYKQASIYLMCSHYEGFPNVVTESKLHGLATIIVGVTYIPQAKKGTINIKEYDVNIVTQEIIKLLKNETYLKEMGQYAKDNSVIVTNEELVDRWIDVYDALFEQNNQTIKFLQAKYNDYSPNAYKEMEYLLEIEKKEKKMYNNQKNIKRKGKKEKDKKKNDL